MTIRACANCVYAGGVKRADYRQCRRNPPGGVDAWPFVRADDWCGEFRAMEDGVDTWLRAGAKECGGDVWEKVL